ncbi:MAG: MBL fold metallo-hydrolase RNA specificity domain-containing protein [Smithellaceae bacterium]
MKITFLGAARTVTGSCYIIETGQIRFAVDCGMYQGMAEIEKRNWETAIYDPAHIDFFIITHAHIDHTGLLPRMAQKGFHGPIYATEPTGDLVKILLLDSAHIQEVEASWKNKKLQRNGRQPNTLPLYYIKDAEAVGPLIKTKTYDDAFSPAPGVKVKFQDAGHILGAAIAEIFIQENGTSTKLVFSGDIGRRHQLLMEEPTRISDADFLFMESTYGNRNHKGEKDSLKELAEAIEYSYSRGEKVIIPAFAVERTQEILYSLYLLQLEGKLPKDIPIFLDSPLAIQATEIFRRYRSYLDVETQNLFKNGKDPLDLLQLKFSSTTAQSMQINEMQGSAIVISASGMANAGRIKHHLRHNLWRPGASIVFVGFQAEGTPGRRMVEGAKKIRIFNEDIVINAKIFTINGFSAHAGQDQLLDWLGHFQNKKMQIFLVHGEFTVQEQLAAAIKGKYGFAVDIPEYLEEIQLKLGAPVEAVKKPEIAESQVDLNATLDDLKAKIEHINNLRQKIQQLSPARKAEIEELLKDADQSFAEVNSRL